MIPYTVVTPTKRHLRKIIYYVQFGGNKKHPERVFHLHRIAKSIRYLSTDSATIRALLGIIPKFDRYMQCITRFFTTKLYILVLGVFGLGCSYDTMAIEQAIDHWQVVKEDNGVTIAQQNTESGYIIIKATTTVISSPAAFIALLHNTDIAPQWIDHCKKVEVLASPTQDERVVHTLFAAPWPVVDRDMVTQSYSAFNEYGDLIITIEDRGSTHPTTAGYVRMRNVHGTWTLRQLDNGKVDIQYIGYGEAAGNIPIWLANKLLVSSLYKTFTNLKKQLTSSALRP